MRTATLLFTCSSIALVPAFALSPKSSAISQPRTLLSSRQPATALRTQRAVTMAASLEAAGAPQSSGTGVTTSVVNLFKNIVGSGVLALAAGVAAFSGSGLALVPSLLILLAVGAASAYTFSTIARVGDAVGASTYRETWLKIYGEKTVFLADATIIFMTAAAGLSYSIIIGDSFASMAQLAGATGLLAKSNFWIVTLSSTVLLPLALLRDLSSLAIGSVIGTAGTLYTALFIWLRKLDGTYAVGGKFNALIAESARPSFAAATAAAPLLNPKIFVLVSMLATAFLAHYNAPKYYQELAEPADGSGKAKAFTTVCAGAFGLAALLCLAIMAGGFLTFGGASQGLILNSYATSDPLALLARLGICASIIFSYPLNFVGLRDGVLNMLGLSQRAGETGVHVVSTVLLLCVMNGLALFLKNLGLVVAVGGAALGTSLVYTFPALMFIQATRQLEKKLKGEGKSLPASRKTEMYANMVLVLVGLSLGGLGITMSLKSAGGH